jgi:hypothetical protein
MSDKGLLFKKRKNNHGSHNRCSQGSGFPRRDMDKFPMVKRYDYEKALRIHEQEQKEADLERQE